MATKALGLENSPSRLHQGAGTKGGGVFCLLSAAGTGSPAPSRQDGAAEPSEVKDFRRK